jgi:hypothetical protein
MVRRHDDVRHAAPLRLGRQRRISAWRTVTILVGQTEVTVDILHDDIVCPPGRMRRSNGTSWTGHDRPRFHVVPTDDLSGSRIVLEEPAPEDVHFEVSAYRSEDDDDGA